MVKFRIRSKHWLEDLDGNVFMGEGRLKIFKIIRRTGSMNRTAKELGMSYRGVWARVKATEQCLNIRIVETDNKKGSRLTPAGEELVKRYDGMKQACVEADDSVFSEFFPSQSVRDLPSE